MPFRNFFIAVAFSLGVLIAGNVGAQVPDYAPLAPIPELQTDVGKTNISTFIPGLIKLTIGVAGGLAVIFIIIGGIQYITTDAYSGKSSAKDTIQNAVFGLILAIGAYTLLNTINPQLVNFDLKLQKLEKGENIDPTTGEFTGGTTNNPATDSFTAGMYWKNDDEWRNKLKEKDISINKFNCNKVGEPSCTSVYDINPVVTEGLIKLKDDCKCFMVVTGGTEYWLHGNRSPDINLNTTPHKPGGRVVDLSIGTLDSSGALVTPSTMTTYLRRWGSRLPEPAAGTKPSCAPGKERYFFKGGVYVNEEIDKNPAHWHVCF